MLGAAEFVGSPGREVERVGLAPKAEYLILDAGRTGGPGIPSLAWFCPETSLYASLLVTIRFDGSFFGLLSAVCYCSWDLSFGRKHFFLACPFLSPETLVSGSLGTGCCFRCGAFSRAQKKA